MISADHFYTKGSTAGLIRDTMDMNTAYLHFWSRITFFASTPPHAHEHSNS